MAIKKLKQLNAHRKRYPDIAAENDFTPHPHLDINVIRAAVEQAFNGQEEHPVTIGMPGNGVTAKAQFGNAEGLQFLAKGRTDFAGNPNSNTNHSIASGV